MDNMPNVYVLEDGTLAFINSFRMEDEDIDFIDLCNNVCKRMEEKYKTKDIYEMMKKGATRKEIIRYMDCRHDLPQWGYE